MNILVIGCGRVGRSFAFTMYQKGHDVVVLDKNNALLEMMDSSFEGIKIYGTPIDIDTLMKAGIGNCDAVCAVTSNDNVNIMVSEIAKKQFHVPIVLTRIADQDKENVYQDLGLTTICPTKLTMDALSSAMDEYVEEQYITYGSHRMKFYTLSLPKHLIGKKAHDIQLEENEVLYAIQRKGGDMTLIVDYDIRFEEGDRLIFSTIID